MQGVDDDDLFSVGTFRADFVPSLKKKISPDLKLQTEAKRPIWALFSCK
jgi:hypothetical protein